jgi:hypothetical protein
MDGQSPYRVSLRLVLPHEMQDAPEEPPGDSESEPAGVLRRRYTVTVQPDGTELVDDMEEWEE